MARRVWTPALPPGPDSDLSDDSGGSWPEPLTHWVITVVGESETRPLPAGVTLREKDVPILCAAIEAKASHLLTLDLRDFGPYLGKSVGGVLVQHPRDYLPAKPGRR